MYDNTFNVRSQTVANDPSALRAALAWRLAGVAGFALATAVAAQVRFYMPDSPVPITAQTLVVVLAGVTLGGALGAASMCFYLLLGVAGYHVFAGAAGDLGFAYLIGPTGGYLAGFLLAQPLIAALTSGPAGRNWRRLLSAMLAGHVVIFALGAIWLSLWAGYGFAETLDKGVMRFLPGLAVKLAVGLPLAAFAIRFRS